MSYEVERVQREKREVRRRGRGSGVGGGGGEGLKAGIEKRLNFRHTQRYELECTEPYKSSKTEGLIRKNVFGTQVFLSDNFLVQYTSIRILNYLNELNYYILIKLLYGLSPGQTSQ